MLGNPGPKLPVAGGGGPGEEDLKLIDAVAGRVVKMGMAVPAVFFLESTKPLSYIGSQVLVFLEPFVKSFLTLKSYDRFVALMEDRNSIELLLRRIEELDEEARLAEKERRREEKERRAAERAPRVPGLPEPRPSLWSRLFRTKGRTGGG